MHKSPTDVMADRIGFVDAAALVIDLKRAGWIVVRHDAIERAQREAVVQVREDADDGWRRIAFKRGELLDEIGRDVWEAAADRLASKGIEHGTHP